MIATTNARATAETIVLGAGALGTAMGIIMPTYWTDPAEQSPLDGWAVSALILVPLTSAIVAASIAATRLGLRKRLPLLIALSALIAILAFLPGAWVLGPGATGGLYAILTALTLWGRRQGSRRIVLLGAISFALTIIPSTLLLAHFVPEAGLPAAGRLFNAAATAILIWGAFSAPGVARRTSAKLQH